TYDNILEDLIIYLVSKDIMVYIVVYIESELLNFNYLIDKYPDLKVNKYFTMRDNRYDFGGPDDD
ncbi:MAG TPA: hypothetical protein VKR58_03525, partial [Aquella sp.]|nr:hypothetical protein [Aquella sp.]